MNNPMATILLAIINMQFYYFGHSFAHFQAGMVEHLKYHRDHVCHNTICAYSVDDKFAVWWTKFRMVWTTSVSVNNLNAVIIVRSFDRFVGEAFVKRVFKAFADGKDINDCNAGQRHYQNARDNIFRCGRLSRIKTYRTSLTRCFSGGWRILQKWQSEVNFRLQIRLM